MKTRNSIMLSALLLAGLTACQQDDAPLQGDGSEVTVTFAAELPADVQSRAYGDGTTAKALTYAVYETGSTNALITSERQVTFDANLTAEVRLQLVSGKEYDILFWADVENGSPYTFDAATQSITVSYANMEANAETRDAFFKKDSFKVTGPLSRSVELRRPLAQVNIGANDLDEPVVAGKSVATNFKAKAAGYSTLNLATGAVSGTPQDLVFNAALTPVSDLLASTEEFPVDGYTYLQMNYLLMPADKTLLDCELTVADTTGELHTIEIPSVPMQRNYRTNIYGALLTSAVDYTVVINPAFEDPDLNKGNAWDGKTTAQPVRAADGVLEISTPAQYAGWVAMVHNELTKQSASGTLLKTRLTADIDLGGHPIDPIGFQNGMVFDGNNHTVYNLNVTHAEAAGMFGNCGTLTVQDLTLVNPVVTATNVGGNGYAGTVVGRGYSDALYITNVHVEGAKITGVNKTGGILGFVAEGGSNLTNCTVANSEITNEDVPGESGQTGGLVGYFAVPNNKIANCSVKNTVINAVMNGNTRFCGQMFGTIGTEADNSVVATDCEVSGNTLTITGSAPVDPKNDFLGGFRHANGSVSINGITYSAN